MSLLSWNYRGLGNQQTVRTLVKVINKQDPNTVFLMETKSSLHWMLKLRALCKYKNGLIVPSRGSSGGLALFWKQEIGLDIQTYSHSHIDAWIDGGDGIGWWHLTGFYGEPDTSKRWESWQILKHLHETSSLPWLAIGDFNEITSMAEKEGGSNRTRQQMKYFVDTINCCGLKEVSFTGPLFTWLYLKEDGSQIRERLDRALATVEWFYLFPMAKLNHLSSSASDHSPLVLQLCAKPRKKRMGRVFRFESMWLKDPRCESIMEEA